MELKLEFTAEIVEDVGNVSPNKVYTEEQNMAILECALRELCGEEAAITVHQCKLTKVT